ncbi:hypothetical protein CPB86DRAFT_875990 [Serendipita vermifera]|nr:hypothetical protein CPB86DRAFT_875990 [Serendipita vermifera]
MAGVPYIRPIFGPPTLTTLLRAAAVVRASRAFNFAWFTAMVWDMILTLPREVALIWNSRWTIVKVLFLLNRYITPIIIAVNLWSKQFSSLCIKENCIHDVNALPLSFAAASGLAKNLTDKTCRDWFSVAIAIQVFSMSSVSFLIAFRIWAWYAMTSRALYFLLFVGFVLWTAALALSLKALTTDRHYIIREYIFNNCITIAPVIWITYLPITLEHGIYLIFLIINAMATPRASHAAAIRIFFRDGILYFFTTFTILLSALLIFAVRPRMEIGYGIFIPWMVCQMAISRLLLDVKTLKAFNKQQQRRLANNVSHELKLTRQKEPKTVISPSSHQHRRDNTALYPSFSAAMSRQNGGNDGSEQHTDPRSRFSSTDEHGHLDTWRGAQSMAPYAHSVGKKSRSSSGDGTSSSSSQGWLMRLVSWLMNPADNEIYVLVDIDARSEDDTAEIRHGEERDGVDVITAEQNHQPTEQSPALPQGGLKVSRLGRFDEWVY